VRKRSYTAPHFIEVFLGEHFMSSLAGIRQRVPTLGSAASDIRAVFRKAARHFSTPFGMTQAAFIASNIVDTYTSFQCSGLPGLYEKNPLLAQGGQFTAVSAVIKFGMLGAVLLCQNHLINKEPEPRKLRARATWGGGNCIGTAIIGSISYNNLSLYGLCI
jgi:hypothetical protein